MFYYQTCLNTLPELGVVINVLPGSPGDDRMVITEVSSVVLNAVVPLLLLTTKVVLFGFVVLISPCDNVCDCEDVAVREMLVSGDALLARSVLFKVEVSVFGELVKKVEWVVKDAVLDEWCVSVVSCPVICIAGGVAMVAVDSGEKFFSVILSKNWCH